MSGTLNVEGMLRQMKPRRLLGWQTYFELEPFGSMRGDYQAGIIAKMIADVHQAKKKDGTDFTLEDFLLKFEEAKPPRKQSVKEKMILAKLIALAYAGKGKNA